MSLPELFGFIITVLAFMFIFYKKRRDENFRRSHPEEYARKQQQQEENLKLFLESLDIETEKEAPPPLPKIIKQKPQLIKKKEHKQVFVGQGENVNTRWDSYADKTDLEAKEFNAAVDKRYGDDRLKLSSAPKYEVHHKRSSSKVKKLIYGLPSLKEMVILQTVMEPPKGMP